MIINWPSVVSSDTIRQCLTAYKTVTCHLPSLPCAFCARAHNNQHIHSITIYVNEKPPVNLNFLKTNAPFLVNMFKSKNDHAISHLSPSLNGLLLWKPAMTYQNNDQSTVLNICEDCYNTLSKNKMPHFSLADQFYCGVLPDEFQDLTWVEGMVCAIYRTSVHVTQLYELSDSKDPFVYHGNTCAHEMNVVSTASVLPHTIDVINSILTVVFVRHKKSDPK